MTNKHGGDVFEVAVHHPGSQQRSGSNRMVAQFRSNHKGGCTVHEELCANSNIMFLSNMSATKGCRATRQRSALLESFREDSPSSHYTYQPLQRRQYPSALY